MFLTKFLAFQAMPITIVHKKNISEKILPVKLIKKFMIQSFRQLIDKNISEKNIVSMFLPLNAKML